MVANNNGVTGFLHPEGVYDDPSGGEFRESLYRRLKAHFQFENALGLFSEIHSRICYSVNVYGRKRSFPMFSHIANLYSPATVDECFEHDSLGLLPGIKDKNNCWNIAGHAHRIVKVDLEALGDFAKVYDGPETVAIRARLPALHASTLISVLHKLANHPKRLGELEDEFYVTAHWHETMSQRDGTIRRETGFPKNPTELILSGPHFFVGNPLYKTPQRECTLNSPL